MVTCVVGCRVGTGGLLVLTVSAGGFGPGGGTENSDGWSEAGIFVVWDDRFERNDPDNVIEHK